MNVASLSLCRTPETHVLIRFVSHIEGMCSAACAAVFVIGTSIAWCDVFEWAYTVSLHIASIRQLWKLVRQYEFIYFNITIYLLAIRC